MNLNAGKAYRARLGFAGLLGTVVLVVGGKALATQGDQPAALVTPSGMPGVAETGRPATGPATGGADGSPSGDDEGSSAGDATASASPTPSPGPTASLGPSVAPTPRTVVGDAIDTKYGPVQVQIVVTGNKITDVVALVLPNRLWRDIQINNEAVPILRQRVLDIQSAKIDQISGASYTSSGYAWSVQSAIDRAGL
ncbi:FMN-binding protein [Pseudofrankia saprophytica]|uniref:FMN-binding protein n=1 Tax=Pseudofrankia saprophytica TaxID=298655 RepID=UPI000234C753|nr:FMN-binding protein [Pseudofrankia saprophytica]